MSKHFYPRVGVWQASLPVARRSSQLCKSDIAHDAHGDVLQQWLTRVRRRVHLRPLFSYSPIYPPPHSTLYCSSSIYIYICRLKPSLDCSHVRSCVLPHIAGSPIYVTTINLRVESTYMSVCSICDETYCMLSIEIHAWQPCRLMCIDDLSPIVYIQYTYINIYSYIGALLILLYTNVFRTRDISMYYVSFAFTSKSPLHSTWNKA